MKHQFNFILILLISLTAFTLACSKEDDNEPVIDYEVSEYGVFDGVKVLQWYVENGELIVPLKTDREIELDCIESTLEEKLPNINVDFRVIDRRLCMTVNAPNIDKVQLPLTFHIKVREGAKTRSEESAEHTLTVVLRSNSLNSSHDELYEYDCIRDAWGCGMSAADEIGGTNKKARIFDFDQLYNYLASNQFSGHDGTTYTMSYQLSGSDYEETTRNYSGCLGVSGSRKLSGTGKIFQIFDKKEFEGSLSLAIDYESHAAEYYEYSVFITKARRKSLKLPAFMDYPTDRLVGYLSESANDVLNNVSSDEYRTYPNTKEGIYALFDRYGTHVMTSCVWGGRFDIVYFRKQNAYQNSVATSFAAHVGIHKENDLLSSDHPLGSWIVQQMTRSGIDVNVGVDSYEEDIKETTKEQMFTMSIGGNANTDPDIWLQSMETANARDYALIALGEPTSEKEPGSSGLISLSCLCLDEARREAMEKYYEQYIMDRSHSPSSKPSMVLADVIMLKDSDNGKGGIDPTKQRVMEDPFGKKRLYTPMYVNQYGDKAVRGEAVETSNDIYITVTDACDQFWYAAVDWPTECNGISDICFSDKSDNTLFSDGWTRRGSRADSDMNWGNIDNNYLCVKYIKDGDRTTERITGFGLAYGDDSENDITKAGVRWNTIFSSSVGTEMRFPFAADSNFPHYWQNFQYSDYSHNSWFGKTGAIHQYLYPVYTKVPIKDRLTPDLVGLPTGNGW